MEKSIRANLRLSKTREAKVTDIHIGQCQLLSRSGLDSGGPGYLGGGGGVGRPKIVGLLKKNKPPTFFARSRSDAERMRQLLAIRSRQQCRRTKYTQNFPPPAAVYWYGELWVSMLLPTGTSEISAIIRTNNYAPFHDSPTMASVF